MLGRFMAVTVGKRWRHVLPWAISIALLVYVFAGRPTGSAAQRANAANVPAFRRLRRRRPAGVLPDLDAVQALALRSFVTHVPIRSVVAVRGGSELLRTISNPLSDAAFFVGLGQLAGKRFDAVLGSALTSGGLPLRRDAVHDDAGAADASGWNHCQSRRRDHRRRSVGDPDHDHGRRAILDHAGLALPGRPRDPLLGGAFPALAAAAVRARHSWVLVLFDVTNPGSSPRLRSGSRSRGSHLAARIPVLYLALSIPTLGNFGTRELTWAALFADYADRDTLIAYALATNAVFLLINLALGLLFLRARCNCWRPSGARAARAKRSRTAAARPTDL